MAKVENEIHVLMIGKPGSGKMSAAKILFNSIDPKIVNGKPYSVHKGLKLIILDLLEDINNFEDKNQALVQFLNVEKHYIIFVLSLLNRITEADEKIFQNFTTLFGEKYGNYAVLIFNHTYVLRSKDMNISEYIQQNGPPVLQRFVSQFNNRYIMIDNDDFHTDFRQDLWIKVQEKCEEGHDSSNVMTHKTVTLDEVTLTSCRKDVKTEEVIKLSEELIKLSEKLIELSGEFLELWEELLKPYSTYQRRYRKKYDRLVFLMKDCITRLHDTQTEHANPSIGIQTEHANPSIGIQTEHANPSIGIQTEHANPCTGTHTEHVHTSETEHVHTSVPPNISMTTNNTVRTVSKSCQTDHPAEPTDMKFELNIEYISNHTSPEFVRDDVTVRNHRHLIFATNKQLRLLSTAKIFFIDCTFKIVSKPFIQLLSIHFFALHHDDMKQLPGVFVLMSRKNMTDYKNVLRQILRLLPKPLEAQRIVLDFESNLWKAAEYVFPDIQIRGCAFHWRQSVWRHVQEIGLQAEYIKTDSAYKFIRKVLALPFLPAEQITETFNVIKETVNTDKLTKLMDYIRDTWISGDMWVPTMWTVYRQSVRTDYDVEGWHNRINTTSNLQLYELIDLLFKEASLLPTELMMVTERKLQSYQKKNMLLQHRLFSLWDQYKENQISVNQLLKKCDEIYGGPVQ